MKKRLTCVICICAMLLSFVSCGNNNSKEPSEYVEVNAFIAASLSQVMIEMAAEFNKERPEIQIIFNADSSGTLQTQIEEGYECDLFFSAAQKQMDALEEKGLLVSKTRTDVLNNQLVVIKSKDADTEVTGLQNLDKATSIALADGSVPAGKYSRTALMNLGILGFTDTPDKYSTEDVSKALGGVEISEQGNVSKVLMAVIESSCEVGCVYYSDTFGFEDQIDIIEMVPYELTGDIIYPISLVANDKASNEQSVAAKAFLDFILSDKGTEIFKTYYFDTEIGR